MENNLTFHILFASRLVEEKWVDILIECIERYQSISEHTLVWHICSNGLYQDQIIALQQKYIENVIYHGFVSPTGLAVLYRQADILLMPSRFLETFGLTALEALASGTRVVGFQKWGLIPFIPDTLALDRDHPVESLSHILDSLIHQKKTAKVDLTPYMPSTWEEHFVRLFPRKKSITLIHDYQDIIWGAEMYVESVIKHANLWGYEISRFSYREKTTPWRRRIIFALSILAFWRFFQVGYLLLRQKPDIIWMHSVLRYIGIWWIAAIVIYARMYNTKLYLSHHDVGLLAPFPQAITSESLIPKNRSLRAFIVHVVGYKKAIASIKWLYVRLLTALLPRKTEHIIFAPFLERHIGHHFPWAKVRIFPHTYDKSIYHP